MLEHLEFEVAVGVHDVDAPTREGIGDRIIQLIGGADLADGLHGRGEIDPSLASAGVVVPICGLRAAASLSVRRFDLRVAEELRTGR